MSIGLRTIQRVDLVQCHRLVNLILRLFTHLALQECCELTGDFLKVAIFNSSSHLVNNYRAE